VPAHRGAELMLSLGVMIPSPLASAKLSSERA